MSLTNDACESATSSSVLFTSSTANCNKKNKKPALVVVVAKRNVSRTAWRPIWRSAILSQMNWKTWRQTDLGGAQSGRTQCNSLKPIAFSVWKKRELSESLQIDAWQRRLWVRRPRASTCVKYTHHRPSHLWSEIRPDRRLSTRHNVWRLGGVRVTTRDLRVKVPWFDSWSGRYQVAITGTWMGDCLRTVYNQHQKKLSLPSLQGK